MEISFTETVKLIHPDSNPDIKNASEKMSLALKNRRDNKALWNLCVRWGVIQGIENPDIVIHGEMVNIYINRSEPWDTGQQPRQSEPSMTRQEYNRRLEEYIRRQEEIEREYLAERVRILEEEIQHRQSTGWEIPEEPRPITPWTTNNQSRRTRWWNKKIF